MSAVFINPVYSFNARLDEEYSATLSRRTIDGLPRGKPGFEGVVISDDLQRGAIVEHYGLETAIRRAIEAEVDILLFGNNLEYDEAIVPKAVAVIRKLVRTGASANRAAASCASKAGSAAAFTSRRNNKALRCLRHYPHQSGFICG